MPEYALKLHANSLKSRLVQKYKKDWTWKSKSEFLEIGFQAV